MAEKATVKIYRKESTTRYQKMGKSWSERPSEPLSMVRAPTLPSGRLAITPYSAKYRSLRSIQGSNIVSRPMEDAEDSKPIVDGAREADTSTPEACVAVSKARAPLKTVDVRRGSNQPRTAWMVNSAILALNEPRGSSIQAIKRYVAANYNIDTKKKALFIKKYLISAVAAGVLHRTSGSGAAGSFTVRKFNPPKQKPEAATKKAVAEQKPEAATRKAVAEKTAVAAKTPIAADKNPAKAFKKQTTADKKLAEVVKKKIAADKKLAEAVKRQAAADKKLAGAMKKLAAADKRAAAQKAASSVVSGKNVNKESAADPPNAKTATSQ